MITLTIDDQEIKAEENLPLLQIALENGIYIPHLCFQKEMTSPPASCRLCFIEVEGLECPVTSCTTLAKEGMAVRTDTKRVRELQGSAMKLLLSTHDLDCSQCHANKKCDLQTMAKFLKISLKPKGLEKRLKDLEIDDSHHFIQYYPNRCVLCGKCIFICEKTHKKPLMSFAKRGLNTIISFFGDSGDTPPPCPECRSCIEICPVGALTPKNSQ